MDRMLTVKEVAGIIGYCENTARDIMRRMPHFVAPGGTARKAIRVWQSDLMAYLAANTVTPGQRTARKKAPAPRVLLADGLDERGRIRRRKA